MTNAAARQTDNSFDAFSFLAKFAPLIFLLLLMAVFAIMEPRFLSSVNLFNVMRQVSITGLLAIENTTVYGLHTMTGRTGSIAFNIADIPAREVSAELDRRDNIAVRGGVHCAPMLHKIIGTGERGAVRASPSSWNTNAEIDAFLEATARIAAVGV